MKFSASESAVLDQLVLDCDRFRLDEKESLLYIKLRFQKEVNRDTYYRRKAKLVSDPYVQQWLSKYARVDYALKHINMMESLESTIGILQRELYFESVKGLGKSDKKNLVAITAQINEISKTLRTVYMDAPFVSALKSELDRLKIISGKIGKGPQYLKGLEDRTRPADEKDAGTISPASINNSDPSALIIPIDSIVGKPQESSKEQREADEPVFE